MTVQAVEEGEKVVYDDAEHSVESSCGGRHGFWMCVGHPDSLSFPNNISKDSHISKNGNHRLGWYCMECGRLEVP